MPQLEHARLVRRALTAATLVAVIALLMGCGEKTVEPDAAGETVGNVVAEETGFEPTDVSCPDDVKAEVGATFDCEFTGPDGDYVAHVRITEVEGDDARFRVVTERADQ